MLTLGIESSCDDTSLALVQEGRLLAMQTASQTGIHALFGGVVPELASRRHGAAMAGLFAQVTAQAGVAAKDIEVVAVSRGPGLLGSLLVGTAFAKALALGLGARFIGVDHLHAHMAAVGFEHELTFPHLSLLVSGGHTQLYLVEGLSRCTLLGRSLDDAAGEAFDKAGKLLGLPYPAGRHMDELAEEGEVEARLFPRPYLDNDTLDFSFSGLKTAMARYLTENPLPGAGFDPTSGALFLPQGEARARLAGVCASFRWAVVETLAAKTAAALARFPHIRQLTAAGGVAANSLLRRRLQALAQERGLAFAVPSVPLCADNGAMIARLGELLAQAGYKHDLDMPAIPRGRKIPDDMLSTPACNRP